MTPFEEYFGGNLFVINLARRPDRMEHFQAEMRQIGVTHCERFDAIDAGPGNGNHGCSASHRAVLDLIAARGLKRAFIFEDDAEIRPQFRENFHEQFALIEPEIPDDFDMFYLSGHYAENPRQRMSPHIILMGEMKTTTSYGVTAKSAAELRDLIGIGTPNAIDSTFAGYNREQRCYISQPRLFRQWENYSDLQQAHMNNGPCMEDTRHESSV